MNRKLLLIFAVAIVAMTQLVSCKKDDTLPPMADKIVSVIYDKDIIEITIFRTDMPDLTSKDFSLDGQILSIKSGFDNYVYYDLSKANGFSQEKNRIGIYFMY